jgi:hypothetical protein
MVLLRSSDSYTSLLDLNLETGAVAHWNEDDDPSLRSLPKDGHYSQLEGHLWCLYRHMGDLHFRLDELDLKVTPDLEVEHLSGKVNHFALRRGGVTLLALDYANPLVIDPEIKVQIAVTPMAEVEDFDFGLFVYNVLTDPGRRDAAGNRRLRAASKNAHTFLKVTESYWAGLFSCDDVPDLPRTNNDLEHTFGSVRYHERRSTGRKQASPGLVIRGAVRTVASVASQQYSFKGPELRPCNLTQWRILRHQVESRLSCSDFHASVKEARLSCLLPLLRV